MRTPPCIDSVTRLDRAITPSIYADVAACDSVVDPDAGTNKKESSLFSITRRDTPRCADGLNYYIVLWYVGYSTEAPPDDVSNGPESV